jgi:hypothetical protein
MTITGVALLAAVCALAEPLDSGSTTAPSAKATFCVIPIDGVIGVDFNAGRLENLLKKASELHVDYVVLALNTPGGSVQDAEKTVDLIINHSDLKFIALVNKALSAGVPIAMSCKRIFVTESATIGAAVSYMPDNRGNPRMIPPDVAEKFQSAWRAVCRKAADHGGHPSLLAEAMVDGDFALTATTKDGKVEFARGGKGEVVKDKGRILTLTAKEAVKLQLGEAVAKNATEVGKEMGIAQWKEIKLPSLPERLPPGKDPALVQKLLEMGEPQRLAIIAGLKKDIKKIGTEIAQIRPSSRVGGESSSDRKERLTELQRKMQKELARLSGMKGTYVPFIESLELGQVGCLPVNIKIVQILGDLDLIAVVGGEHLWLNGFPTAGRADGDTVSYDGLVEITGNKTYATAGGGTRTIRLMQPSLLRIKDITDYIEQQKAVKKKPVGEPAPTAKNKAAEMLAMARNYQANGLQEKSEQILRSIIKEYPDSPEAGKAAEMLKSK